MGKSLIKSLLSQRIYRICSLGAVLIIGYYITINWGYGAEGFYIFGFAKFLVFGCLYDLLLFLRIRMYTQIENLGILRIGKNRWFAQIMKIEALFLNSYLLVVFILLPLLNGIENIYAYIVGLIPLLLIWELGFFAEMWFLPEQGKELYGFFIAFVALVLFTYAIGPALYALILG